MYDYNIFSLAITRAKYTRTIGCFKEMKRFYILGMQVCPPITSLYILGRASRGLKVVLAGYYDFLFHLQLVMI